MFPADLRAIFETVLPQDVIQEAVNDSEYQLRERKKDAVLMVNAMVAASAGGRGGRQAAVLQMYTNAASVSAGRSGMYKWFDDRLAATLRRLSAGALRYAQKQKIDLPGWIGEDVEDWLIVDSTTCKLHQDLQNEYPGTGDYAAIKLHKRMSVGTGCVVDYHFSAAREHDSLHLKLSEQHRGYGLLADLGYASFDRLEDCGRYGVKYVIRLKDSWKPTVTEINRGSLKKVLKKSADFDMVLADNLLLDGKCIDMTVVLTKGKREITARVVGICAPDNTYRWYLSNLPSKRGPQQISDLYRVRWEIEGENKLSKSCFALDEMSSKTVGALHAMLHAAMIGTILSCLITHAHRVDTKPLSEEGKVPERDVAPLHPRLVAGVMQTMAHRIGEVLTTTDEAEKKAVWEKFYAMLLQWGVDTNWRTRPSILDQLRGWRIRPYKRPRARLSSNKR